MNILLIHDARSVAFLTGVVLCRLHTRRGDTVTPFSGLTTTRHAADFWQSTIPKLAYEGIDQVILCCMTFDDLRPEECVQKIANIEAMTGRPPIILSHRWPDGYSKTPYRILIPPFDILEQYSSEIQPEERELLRLSLIVSRQAAPQFVSPADFRFSEFLGTAIWKSDTDYWKRLTDDLPGTLGALRAEFESEPSARSEASQRPESQGQGYARFALPESAYGHCEKTIEDFIR